MQALSFHQRCCKSTFSAKKPFPVFLRLFERLLRLFNFELLYCSPGSVDVLGGCCAMCKHCHSIRDAVKVHFQLKPFQVFLRLFERLLHLFNFELLYCSPGSVDVLGGCCAMCKHCHSIRDAVKVHFQLKNPSKFSCAFL